MSCTHAIVVGVNDDFTKYGSSEYEENIACLPGTNLAFLDSLEYPRWQLMTLLNALRISPKS